MSTSWTWRDIPLHKVKPGDFATHVNGELDARRVVGVVRALDPQKDAIWIELFDTDAGPYPLSNYTYRRRLG